MKVLDEITFRILSALTCAERTELFSRNGKLTLSVLSNGVDTPVPGKLVRTINCTLTLQDAYHMAMEIKSLPYHDAAAKLSAAIQKMHVLDMPSFCTLTTISPQERAELFAKNGILAISIE